MQRSLSAASSGVRRFIFMSTVKVSGEGREVPYCEDDIPGPSDPYGISKWETEKRIKAIADETGMESSFHIGSGIKTNGRMVQ